MEQANKENERARFSFGAWTKPWIEAWGMVILFLLLNSGQAGCCARRSRSRGRPKSGPTARARPAKRLSPVPRPEDLSRVQECERSLGVYRLCLWKRAHGSPTLACTKTGSSWRFLGKLNVSGYGVLSDLSKGYDEMISCGIELQPGISEEQRRKVVAAGFDGTVSSKSIWWGGIPLRRLLCVAALEQVRQMDCNNPPPELN